MRGSLLGDDSLTQMGHRSMKSLIHFDIPGHQTDILAHKRHLWIP